MTTTALTARPRVALITGCSSGIGAATARHLRDLGFEVYATARKLSSLTELAAAGCKPLALDVTDAASIDAAVRTIEDAHGAIDVLVNNAGYSQSGAIEAIALDRVRAQFETNVFGLVALTQRVLPAMRARRAGRIVNLSSMGGKLVFPGGGFYHATKYAVEAISDALRFEVRGFGIRVVVIEPGLIRSGFADAAVGSLQMTPAVGATYDAFHAAVAKATVDSYQHGMLSKLAGEPQDVARVIGRAVTVRRPSARYRVTLSATMLMAQRRLSSDHAWDWFLRRSFPSPQ